MTMQPPVNANAAVKPTTFSRVTVAKWSIEPTLPSLEDG